MKRKYLKKITVSARFFTQILTKDEFKGLSDDENQEIWRLYLISLAITKLISNHQANTWKYPDKNL